MIESIVFVYAKGNEVKVLSLEDKNHEVLKQTGWKHTQTLDAGMFIQYLANNNDVYDICKTINSLKQ